MPYLLRDIYGHDFPVTAPLAIGRGLDCQIILSDRQASRLHATVWEERGILVLRDENSRNGTFVNDQRVRQTALQPGDHIRIGDTLLVAAALSGWQPAGQPAQIQAPVPARHALTRPKTVALIAGGALLLCALLSVGIFFAYPFFSNHLAFLPQRPATPEAALAGSEVSIVAVSQPQKMLTPLEYEAAIEQLAQAIQALNLAELRFIQDSRSSTSTGPGADPVVVMASFSLPSPSNSLDTDLCEVAAQAMDAGRTAESLMHTAAAQAEESQLASTAVAQYSSIARLSFALVIDAQNLRQGLKVGSVSQEAAIRQVAEYGLQLWNPIVSLPGVDGNPFMDYVENLDNVFPAQFLSDDAVASLMSKSGQGSQRLSWLATSASEVTRTIDLPPFKSAGINPFDADILQQLTTASGQTDAERAMQVAAVKLRSLVLSAGQNESDLSSSQVTFSAYKGVALAGTYALQDIRYPTFPHGNAVSLDRDSDRRLGETALTLLGADPPILGPRQPVRGPAARIDLNFTSIREKQRWDNPNKNISLIFFVTMSWEAIGYHNPDFSLQCSGGKPFNFTSTRGSVTLEVESYAIYPSDKALIMCRVLSSANGRWIDSYNIDVKVSVPAGEDINLLDTPTSTWTPTITSSITFTPQPTLTSTQSESEKSFETQVAAQKTAEFLATVTEIARQTENASASGVHTLTGTFGMNTDPDGCTPSSHSSGSIKITLDLAHNSASGSFSGSGNAANPGLLCNGITYDMTCSISYSGSFNSGVIDSASGVLTVAGGTVSGNVSCHFSNCKQDGVDIACPSTEGNSPINGPLKMTGMIDKAGLSGNGTLSVCPECRGDWSAGQ
jgi:hypothetical protein